MVTVASWGRLAAPEHNLQPLASRAEASAQIQQGLPGLAFGNGRSYGDVPLNPGHTLWSTANLNRFISFDEQTGLLTCESGVLLADIQQTFTPRGWMLPVTPGTQFVTVGGAIANDVHGKNHHTFGTFGEHITALTLARTDGELIECGPTRKKEWFAATVGGLGLTGVILQASIQLRPVKGPWIDAETIPFHGLPAFFKLSDESANWEHTVSWIDCLSGPNPRGLFMRGNHTALQGETPPGRPLSIPIVPPVSLVNRLTLKPFNTVYYHLKKARAGRTVTHYQPFFYPLDNIHHWNRLYGPNGFYQYQCVVPPQNAEAAVADMLAAITKSGQGSFLAVLKTFGARPALGMLSFPQEGTTLALDFPNLGLKTLTLLATLDGIVQKAGGRIYPAKDARMPAELFHSGYPRLKEFTKYRDPNITSAFAQRVLGK